MIMLTDNLKIGCHNIQGGAKRKLSHKDVVDEICQHDIYCIQESWLHNEGYGHGGGSIDIPGYKVYKSLRKKGKKKHVFGGSLIYFKKEYEEKHVKKIQSNFQDMLWVWVDGKHFKLPCDLYLCCVYIPHEYSNI